MNWISLNSNSLYHGFCNLSSDYTHLVKLFPTIGRNMYRWLAVFFRSIQLLLYSLWAFSFSVMHHFGQYNQAKPHHSGRPTSTIMHQIGHSGYRPVESSRNNLFQIIKTNETFVKLRGQISAFLQNMSPSVVATSTKKPIITRVISLLACLTLSSGLEYRLKNSRIPGYNKTKNRSHEKKRERFCVLDGNRSRPERLRLSFSPRRTGI